MTDKNNAGILPEEYSQSNEEVYVFPASYAQQRLWFLDQFEPGSPYYNIPSAMRIRGKFSIPVFKNVIEEIARRHESLRTNFSAVDGKPVQVISPNVTVPFSVIDLMSFREEEKESELKRLLTEKARCSFNLSCDPLIRITVLKLNSQDHVVIVVMHHIISDGWSMGVLVQEISTLYNAFSLGMPSPLDELSIQYADYSIWQKEFLQGEMLERQLDYWKGKLGNSSQYLDLPTDRPRPAVWTNNGSTFSGTIPQETLDRLMEFCRREKVTLFMTLMAAFQVLLHKYSGQDDISIGTPIANRTRRELEGIIGLFINTIVIRTGISGRDSFRNYLQKVRAVTLEAYDNQDLPFEFLVEKLQPGRDMSYQPLFQVMFILQNLPLDSQPFKGLELSMLDVDMGTSTFDITLTIAETFEGLDTTIEYNTDLFNENTISRMLGHYRNLLNNIFLNPDEAINNLRLMDDAEKNRLLYEWNNSAMEFEKFECIHSLFERHAELNPEKIAAVFEGNSLSYKELNEKSNQLAHKLLKMGVGPEDIVGICIERSLEMLISVLGVLKAGGAYLPLDASYPEDRLKFMLEDADVKTLITQSHLTDILPVFSGTTILIDKDREELLLESILNPVCASGENNLVYVIYTSGSTGKPKGTMISHASLINAYLAWEKAYELTSRANSHLQMASFSFDVFAGDWTRALCSGGKLVIAPREILLEGEKLYGLMRKEEVNIAEFVPAVLRNLIQYLDESGENLNFFHLLIAGSDIWYAGEYRKFQKYCGLNTRLINSFGLTEATIDSSCFESTNLDIPNERLVPIGRPFSNMTLYVLDENYEPLAAGLKGELYVGGKGLARGYLRRPEITAEKFIPDPFSKIPGSRLYRTGDMARFLPDGNVEFLGRIDNQIKLRGLRVELGEIETAISEFDNVKDAVVIAREDNPGDKRIAAYIVPLDGNPIPMPELKRFLSERLPEFMIPSAFLILPELPITPNGKVDRRALPAPNINEILREMESNYAAPRSAAEGVIAAIWSDILKIPKVGINDNFFELGGHSLLATQVISRIRTQFNLEIPLRSIFENPTVARLCHVVEKEEMNKTGMMSMAVLPAPRGGSIPLSYTQERLWFLDQLEPGNSFYNMPETYRIKGKLNKDILEESINEIVKRHEILRTSFLSVNGKAVAKIAPELKIKINFTDLSVYPADEQYKIIESISTSEVQSYIPLNEAPLFRTSLIKISEEEHIIIVVLHHIITDEWSSVIMLKEIAFIYNSLFLNNKPVLPELKIQYTDYAFWQREYLKGENLQRQLEYWKSKLTGIPSSLELPFDHPRPPEQTYRGDYISMEVRPELVKSLREFNRHNGVTLFMTMLSIFDVLLYRLTSQTDIVVGTPVANRSKEELEALIGFFVNTLVLRSRINKSMTFLELLSEVMQTSLEAYTYQDLPFEMLVEALEPQRTLSHSPLFQVMFALQNAPVEEYEFTSDLKLFPHEVHSMTSKFDLTLFISEKSEDEIAMAFEYNTDLFEKETIERMFRYYTSILERVLIDCDLALSAIPLLSQEEESAVIEKLAGAHAPRFSLSQLPHEAFERTASLKGETTALVFMESNMTFGELNSRSNKLAHYLMERGIGPETVVGIALKKSPELILSLLAVLKSGGCYLPLDTNYPEERLQYIIKDSKLKLLITEKELVSKFGPFIEETVLIDMQWDEIEKKSNLNPEINRPHPDNLAYIIYTSGSTGMPKGTMITHRNLMNYFSWCLGEYPLNEKTGSIFHLSISFDAAVTSIYPALLSGSPVKIIADDMDIYRLGKELSEGGRIGTLKITPAHMDVLTEQLKNTEADKKNGDTFFSLKAFVVGGENLTGKQISYYQNNYPGTLIFNEYGPTEATVGCVVFEASGTKTDGSVPIGRVIPGVYVYILDETLNFTAENIPGELYIGGLGLSRGYLGKPDLTAEKFIPDPLCSTPGMRLYKTGDKVKLLKDGNIEFLGRLDEQVKLHGYRIELGEIESVLKQHSEVKEALVLKHYAEEKLVAYLIPKNEQTPEVKALREFLEKKVPGYMVPSIFMFIEKFPLTVNGKIDRKKLPAPKLERTEMINGFAAPVSEAELLMTSIWQNVLKVDNIGVTDNFFELGGDSIISIQLVARANQAGFRLTPKDIFQNPTIKALATLAGDGRIVNAPQAAVIGEIPLSPVQNWFFSQQLFNIHYNNQSILFEVDNALDFGLLELVIKEILIHHDALRIRFSCNNEKWEQYNRGSDANVPLVRVDISDCPDEDLPAKIEKLATEFQGSLNICNDPLKAVYFVAGKSRKHYLLIVVHHLLIDAVSWRILLEDFQTAYQQASQGRQIRLPLKTSSFMEWSRRLNEHAQSPEIKAEFNFWRKLENLQPHVLEGDYPASENPEGSVNSVRSILEPEETRILLKELPAVLNSEITHPLLAALVKAFTRITGKTGLLFELESHGRADLFPELDVSRTIGWFTSIYPVYLNLENSIGLKESVENVKSQLSLFPNNGIGFGMLKYLTKDESLRSVMHLLPQPEIAFNYLGRFEDSASEDSSILPVHLSRGLERDPSNKRLYQIEITAAVVQGRLEVEWSYNGKKYKENTILSLAGAYLEELRSIVNFVKSHKIDLAAKNFSDFGWDRQEVDNILSVINRMQE